MALIKLWSGGLSDGATNFKRESDKLSHCLINEIALTEITVFPDDLSREFVYHKTSK